MEITTFLNLQLLTVSFILVAERCSSFAMSRASKKCMGLQAFVVTVKSKWAKEKMLHASKKDMRTEEFFFSIISQLINYLNDMCENNRPVQRNQSSSDQVHCCCFNSWFVMSWTHKIAFLYTLPTQRGDSLSSTSPNFWRRVEMWKWFRGVGHTIHKWGVALHRVAYSLEFLEIDFSVLSSQCLGMPFFSAPNNSSTFDKMTTLAKTMLWGVN